MTSSTRRLRYQVAASLDGYIAGPNGEADWIVMDPELDFTALFAQFDTVLIGRRTFDAIGGKGGGGGIGMATYLVSRTFDRKPPKGVTVIRNRVAETVAELKAKPGKDIWLFGGGDLFRSLAELGLVDTVEVALMPVLLGGGIPLRPAPAPRLTMTLTSHRVYPTTGTVMLEYSLGSSTR